jgi:enoyl-CoA hydratase/carnithine racemase
MCLIGRVFTTKGAAEWGLVNKVVNDAGWGAVDMAHMSAENSPDAVTVSREGIKMGWEGFGAEEGTRLWQEIWYPWLLAGENVSEGVHASVEKRESNWKAAKLC